MALLNGIVDAAALFPRHEAGLNAAGGKFLYNELTPNPQEVIGAMQPWITANEDTVYAWALAEIRARQWLFDRANKDEAYKLVRDYGFEVPPEFVAQYEEELGQISPDGGFGDPALMDDFMAQLVVTGNVPEGAEWRDHFDFKYIWAAQEELGLPRRPATL
jgi:ABC-type nitrate/sulfonate/bicarbonate transport system substrate-binding protein